jgi:hypothetical protein
MSWILANEMRFRGGNGTLGRDYSFLTKLTLVCLSVGASLGVFLPLGLFDFEGKGSQE